MDVTIRIRRLLRSAAVVAFLFGFGAFAEDQANIPPRSDYASIVAAIDPMIGFEMEDKQLPAFSIALVDGNEIVWAQGFGYQDPERKIPATAHTVYRVGSVSKLFTDIAIMQMVESGKISLDASVSQSKGSRHNRGCAVDLTLYDLNTGTNLPMTGGYDEMSERSYAFYPGGTSLQRWDRALLRKVLEEEGFAVYAYEWWHFDYKDWQQYPVLNLTFEQLSHRQNQSRLILQGWVPGVAAASLVADELAPLR